MARDTKITISDIDSKDALNNLVNDKNFKDKKDMKNKKGKKLTTSDIVVQLNENTYSKPSKSPNSGYLPPFGYTPMSPVEKDFLSQPYNVAPSPVLETAVQLLASAPELPPPNNDTEEKAPANNPGEYTKGICRREMISILSKITAIRKSLTTLRICYYIVFFLTISMACMNFVIRMFVSYYPSEHGDYFLLPGNTFTSRRRLQTILGEVRDATMIGLVSLGLVLNRMLNVRKEKYIRMDIDLKRQWGKFCNVASSKEAEEFSAQHLS